MRFWFSLIVFAVLVCGCLEPQKKLDFCENKTEQYEKDACYLEFAVIGRDASLCNTISSENSRLMCDAIVLNDSSKCGKINGSEDSKNVCQAYGLRDPSYCENVKSKTARVNCYSISLMLNKESSKCERFEKLEYRDLCYIKNAHLANDTTLCGEIQNQTLQQSCYKKPTNN